ncbi:MAG: phage tail protein [Rubrivivax sp.]|nr:phage tail protein [Rubrivivax sp.]
MAEPQGAPQRDAVEISIRGQVQSRWTRYEIDSNLMTPADAWSVSLSTSGLSVPAEVTPGAAVRVTLGGDVALTGVLDERTVDVSEGAMRLHLSGRDQAAVLLDCSAPITSGLNLNLDEVIARIVRPLGITSIRIEADTTLPREKVSTEPGDSAWDALRRAAEANGLWAWFEPDGTLVVGGPRYDVPAVCLLQMRTGTPAAQNNLLRLAETRSLVPRYSHVTVLGQAAASGSGAAERKARAGIQAQVQDTGVPVYRPRVLVDHEATSVNIARARAIKAISDGRVQGYTLQALVQGHRVPAGQPGAGQLWTPGQRVELVSDPHQISGTFFLLGRTFMGGEGVGQVTQLTLKEDGAWVPQAHPSTRRHRRGKNSVPGGVIDLTRGAP